MTPEEITAMAREAGFGRNGFSECLVRGSRGVWIDVQDEVNRLVALVAEKAAADERKKYREVEMMAECMDMVRQELIDAGVINKSVPPMMVADAVRAAIYTRIEKEREACAQVCDDLPVPDELQRSGASFWEVGTTDCAAAIRARGQKGGV